MKKLFVLTFTIITIFYFVGCSKSDSPAPLAAPTITSFAPVKDTTGAQVTITGNNFSTTPANNIVKFNGVSATVLSATATQIVVTIPTGLNISGTVTITISGQTATSTSNFKLLSRNEVLILGNWIYKNSIRSDTVVNGGVVTYANSFQYTNPNPSFNYLIFTDSGKAYSFQQAWGQGQSGALYKDTINYSVNNNQIFLLYPAGTNNYSGGFTYLAYQDTINIKSLTGNSFSLSRYYHYKHFTYNTGETKQSIDSLIK